MLPPTLDGPPSARNRCSPADRSTSTKARSHKHERAPRGFSHIVRILLANRADVYIASEIGTTALLHSAQNGHLAVTVDLLRAGANRRRAPLTVPCLFIAADRGHLDVVAAQVEAGANIDGRAGDGRKPLWTATFAGRFDAVRELLRMKANPLLPMSLDGQTGRPARRCRARGHSEVVRELILHRRLRRRNGWCSSPGTGRARGARGHNGRSDRRRSSGYWRRPDQGRGM